MTDDLREALIQAIGHHFCGAGSGPEIEALGQSMAEAVVDDALKELAAYFERTDVVERTARRLRQEEWKGMDEWDVYPNDHEYWRRSARTALHAAIGVNQ